MERGRLAPLLELLLRRLGDSGSSSSVPLLGNATGAALGVGDGAGVLGRSDLMSVGSIAATLDDRRIAPRFAGIGVVGSELCGAASAGEEACSGSDVDVDVDVVAVVGVGDGDDGDESCSLSRFLRENR